VDDQRIRDLVAEVLGHLRGDPPGGTRAGEDLESRVGALEQAIDRLQGSGPPPTTTTTVVVAHTHPSLHVLNVPGGSDRCVLEPDKPCIKSQACRVLGH
jgi:hypothetical protein